MKAVVFAYHNMGLVGLKALQAAGFTITAVFSHEDDPRENCWFGSVKAWGEGQGIPVHCPEGVNGPEWIGRIRAMEPDMIFSFYYRYMLSQDLLDLAPRGAYNLHGSLLPAYRGRCPVNWVLVHGEARTGVTLHHMVRKADAGDIVAQVAVDIDPADTARSLYDKLCTAAEQLLAEALPGLKAGTAPRIPQDPAAGSYFGGRGPEDGRIDWKWPARQVYNLIRAVTDPYPGAFSTLPDGNRILLWWGKERETPDPVRPPGTIRLAGDRVLIDTGRGRIELEDIEVSGSRMRGPQVFAYFKDKEGMTLT